MINENKIILFGDKARTPIYDGMKKVYDAVRVTMGPAGRNVLIENELMIPKATKDGVTVASCIKLSDKKQDMGAQLIKNVSKNTANTSGDGTSSSTVLSFSMLDNGMKFLNESKDTNLIDFKRGMDYATKKAVEYLKGMSTECKTKEEIHKIAMISSNGDKEISDLVTDAVYKTRIENEDGVVSVTTSTTFESNVEYSDAVVLNSGFHNMTFLVNKFETFMHESDDVRVLIFDGELGDLPPSLKNIIVETHKAGESLMIIANDFSPNVRLNFSQNISQRGFKGLLITSPEYGAFQKNVLRDLAVATGTTVIGGEGSGNAQLSILKRGDLGYARNVIATNDKTYIKVGLNKEYVEKMMVNTNGSDVTEDEVESNYKALNGEITTQIEEYCKGLKHSKTKMRNDYEIAQMDRRIKNLSSTKSTINLYAMSEVEVEENKQRAEDAVFATNSAIDEGYVMGGGVTLAKIAKRLESDISTIDGNESFIKGYSNIIKSITQPMVQILNNAYRHPLHLQDETTCSSYGMIDIDLDWDSKKGYNVRTLAYVDDMFESGVVDPTKVVRCSLQNANSISSVALTTECLIYSDGYYSEELSAKENHNLMYNEG